MTRIGASYVRTTSQLTADRLLTALRRTQADLLQAQTEISTGQKVNRPSDASESIAAILGLRSRLSEREQNEKNLQFSLSMLNLTDQSLGEVSDMLLEAKSVAASQIGITSDAVTRGNQATVIDAQIEGLLEIVNRRYQDVPLFAGNQFGDRQEPVFVEAHGGVLYRGAIRNMQGQVGLVNTIGVNSTGTEGFGALSSRVKSVVDLDPQATEATKLSDLGGATGFGVRKAAIFVDVGGTKVTVDLASAETLGDVVTRVNAAIESVSPGAGELTVSGAGLALVSNGPAITISDPNTGTAAADLGIALSATGATVQGGDLHRRLTEHSELSALGAAVDWTSGLKITQGITTKVADFSNAETVQDLINVVQQLDLGLRFEVNTEGTSLNLISGVSGVDLSIGENGGSTASDLGLRTFGLDTRLADLNHGNGVKSVAGEDDFEVRLHDGRSFAVNIDGVTTIRDLITAVQDAATAGGIGAGDFTIALATDGNGLVLTDNTGGAESFTVTYLNESQAAMDLGIFKSVGADTEIAGSDVAMVRADSVFTHLINLRNALLNDSDSGITLAAERIESDIDTLARVRADVGVRAQQIESQQTRSSELKILERSMLSELQDADLTEVITRFTQLQQQLQASLSVGAQRLQLSLLDFLR